MLLQCWHHPIHVAWFELTVQQLLGRISLHLRCCIISLPSVSAPGQTVLLYLSYLLSTVWLMRESAWFSESDDFHPVSLDGVVAVFSELPAFRILC